MSGMISEILRHKGANVWTVPPDATVFEAIQQMADKNVGALLVMGRFTMIAGYFSFLNRFAL